MVTHKEMWGTLSKMFIQNGNKKKNQKKRRTAKKSWS